jgi:hypothetical protein
VGVPGAEGAAGAGGFVFTVVRMWASEEMAALNLLADASGLSGVKEREVSDLVSDDLEIERRLEENIEVGFKRRFGACVSVEVMAACQLSLPSPTRLHWRSVALPIFNRGNVLYRDWTT